MTNCRPGFLQPCANIGEGTRLTSRSGRFTPRGIDSDMDRVGEWPFRLRRRYAAACLLGSRVRTPLREWMMFVSCVGCVLSGSGLCDGPITRPEESYWVCVFGCVWSKNLNNETA